MKLSLGVVLAVCLAGLQFLAVFAVVMSSYFTSEKALLEHARSLLSDVATNTIEHSKGFLTPARGAAELAARLAENQIVSSNNSALLEKLLFQQLQTAPQFAGLFYGSADGDFVYVMKSDGPGPFRTKIVRNGSAGRTTTLIWRNDSFDIVEIRDDPEDLYDPRNRPWYQRAKDTSALAWTDPYIFFTSQEPGITVASPVVAPDGFVRGVIGVDIEISAISDFLSHLKVGQLGNALILNRNGDVIAHPDLNLIKTENDDGTFRFLSINEIGDPIARSAFGTFLSDGEVQVETEISSTFKYNDADYVSVLKPIESDTLPWTIAVYAPETDFTAGIRTNRTQNIGIAAVVAGLTAILGLLIARHIHRPVRALALRATQISRGEYDEDTPFPKTFRELESANETMTREIARRKKSELEYGRTFDLSSRGMAQISPEDGAFLRVNKKFARITGYSPSKLLGMSITDIVHKDAENELSMLTDAGGGGKEYMREARLRRKSGESAWVMLNAVMIHDENDMPLHTVITLDDVTEAKEAEAQIRKLNADLTHHARLNTMGEMAAGIAHEINQPLTAITQNADAALSTATAHEKPDPELVGILKELDEQAHRAGDIIRSLRSFIRKDDTKRALVDLHELIPQTVRLVQAEARENDVELTTQLSAVPKFVGNRVQIAQVLINLMRNAIDSVSAQERDGPRTVLVQANSLDDTTIELCVEDNGPGVDPKIDPFAQFETTKPDGMGLGLSISRGIMEAHGGRLHHEKTPDGTTRFCCTFRVEGQ